MDDFDIFLRICLGFALLFAGFFISVGFIEHYKDQTKIACINIVKDKPALEIMHICQG